ncbi:phage tail tape measure protein [Marinobacter xiaoshiensis]|uniref:Phage tail tape measure protein n=1 Tax=Marinobacter xiaoshiensis TaxID=3073652 RepID=A0ABU2HHH9_9GAMM|nr:phage tail tape measure protein [Marinobacter sp. F60267]MDS1310502.1 phage tail tape measure protein [Marinobacter sp. F60267]
MADKQKTIEIIFGGVDKTGSAISSVGRNLESLTGKVGDLTGPLAGVADSVLKLDAALAAAAIGVTAYAVKIADDFDTAFGEIATLIGQPADNLRDFQAQILQYSNTSTASLDQITSATYGAISAGVDYSNSLGLIAAAERLSIAGKADLGDTTAALVSTMNAFGASADEAGAYADTFFTAVKLGQTTIPELSATMGRLAPIASAAGLGFDEMAAAIATITAETGTSTAEAITGIRAAITSLLKPSSEARDVAADLGIEFNAAALKSKGFAGILDEVAKATGGNTEIIAKLFGSVEALAPVLALTGNASEKFGDNLKAFETNAGAAEIASRELTDTLGNLGQTLQNNVSSALIGVGGKLTDETRGVVKSMTSIFNSLGNEITLSDGAFAPILNAMEGLAQDIDSRIKVIAENFPEALSNLDMTGLLDAFGYLGNELGGLFKNLFGEVDLSSAKGLEDVLQRIVDAFTALVNVSAGIIDGLKPLFALIGEGIDRFQDLDEATKRSIGEMLGLAKTINTLLPAVGALGSGLDSIGTGLTALAGAQGFKALIGNLGAVQSVAAGAGKFGLVGAALLGAGAAGYGIGTIINDTIIKPLEDALGGTLGGAIYDLLHSDEIAIAQAQWEGYASELRRSAKDSADLKEINEILNRSLGETAVATEEQQSAWQKYANELVEAANSGEAVASSQGKVAGALDEMSRVASDGGGALAGVSQATLELANSNKSLQLGYDETTGKVNSFSGTVIGSGKALADAAEKTKEVVRQTEAYELKLLELNSNERIKLIDAKVSLDIAEFEANTKRVEAIAETLGKTFENTGDVITSLFGGIDDAYRMTQLDMASQIKKENEYRKQALDDQSKLTQAQIDNIRQKTQNLKRGDALIKVDGAGLQPHLEAFMFEILREIQVRVNADGEEMLLGLS